jgi:bifunctional UDP-N-acetylglucosamine pyrophosphorylase / glucosamine-1-phosphate N-acetyltransferase
VRRPATTAMVLAAGVGSRMRSDLPKVLHQAAGRPLLEHVLMALRPLSLDRTVAVVSSKKEDIQAALSGSPCASDLVYAVQDPPAGTADAVRVALAVIEPTPSVLVVPGDTPLLTATTLARLIEAHATGSASATVLTAEVPDPSGYGRVVRGERGAVDHVVEERDATEDERTIKEINAGVYAFEASALTRLLEKVDRENAQGEYYLTDVIGLLRDDGQVVDAVPADASEVMGVNTRRQLAEASAALRNRICDRWLSEGVTIIDPRNTYIDAAVTIAGDAIIHPFSFLEGGTVIRERAVIGPHARIVDSVISSGAVVSFSVVAGSKVGPAASVGPFSSLRPGTVLERGARVGSFVESKNTVIGEGSKANHLAYLGDAEIGRGVNVGAGTITCNWDGRSKHRTVIEDDAYIGSDTMLVAPTRIGKRAATGAGSVVKGDVPDDALAVGMPARVIEGKGGKMSKKTEGAPLAEGPDPPAGASLVAGTEPQVRPTRGQMGEDRGV